MLLGTTISCSENLNDGQTLILWILLQLYKTEIQKLRLPMLVSMRCALFVTRNPNHIKQMPLTTKRFSNYVPKEMWRDLLLFSPPEKDYEKVIGTPQKCVTYKLSIF